MEGLRDNDRPGEDRAQDATLIRIQQKMNPVKKLSACENGNQEEIIGDVKRYGVRPHESFITI
jgi:hypothetical protein